MHSRISPHARLLAAILTVALIPLVFSCKTVPPEKNPHDVYGIAPVEFPADLSEAVKSDPEARIGELIAYIEEHAETERQKVRYAHDWITQNVAYDLAQKDGEAERVTDAYGVIAHGKSVCAGYANAFKMLLDRLGIENRLLNGYARAKSFQPFEEAERKPEETNHAWTAVRLDGQWRLIDSTWNAGYTNEEGFEFAYEHDYYMLPPRGFLHTHFNPDQKWQLLEEPVSFSEFVEMPYLHGSFFRLGMRPDPRHKRITVLKDESESSLRLPYPRRGEERLYLHTKLIEHETGERLRNYTLEEPAGEDELRVRVRFPGPGRYAVKMSARTMDNEYYGLGSYFFEVESLDDPLPPFPSLHPRFFEMGMELDKTHAGITVLRGRGEDELLFPLPRSKGKELGLRCKLEERETGKEVENYELVEYIGDNRARVRVRFPGAGSYRLILFARDERKDYHYLGSYFFEVESLDDPLPPFPVFYNRAYEYGVRDLRPLEAVLEKRERIRLSFRGSEEAQFYIRADGDYIRIPYDKASARYEVETPPVSEELYLAVSYGGGYRYLAKYVVE